MTVVETGRMILRGFMPDDWGMVNTILADPDVTHYMHYPGLTEAQRRQWFTWCIENDQLARRDAYNWALVLRDTGVVIGWLGIGASRHPLAEGERDFGYALSPHYWGQGYMTEALQAILAYEFDHLKTPRIVATCETTNHASARVMEKAGMHREETSYNADSEGNWAERHRYAIQRPPAAAQQGICTDARSEG